MRKTLQVAGRVFIAAILPDTANVGFSWGEDREHAFMPVSRFRTWYGERFRRPLPGRRAEDAADYLRARGWDVAVIRSADDICRLSLVDAVGRAGAPVWFRLERGRLLSADRGGHQERDLVLRAR